MADTPAALVALPESECWALLADFPLRLGRVGFRVGDATVIYPMNYAIADGTLYLRTQPTSELTAAVGTQEVAFEVDDVDAEWRSGWSVLVRGRLREVVDPDELALHRELPLRSWAPGERLHLLCLEVSHISGRRLG